MSEPLKLAADLERQRAKLTIPDDEDMADHYLIYPHEQRLICAALRLAEAYMEDGTAPRTWLLRVREAAEAYRKAKEG